jgi:hypothetical protein
LPASVRIGAADHGHDGGAEHVSRRRPPIFKFQRHGQHGTWVSELFPHVASIVDDIAIVKSLNSEAINHDPAITFISTGAQQPGKASLGSWISYGLGSSNRDMPAYVVLRRVVQGQRSGVV